VGLLSEVISVAKRLVEAGYPESTAMKIATGELPMDQASRMARAKEQGFTEKAYHTGQDSNNPQGILNLTPPSTKNAGTFFSSIPEITASYTGKEGSSPTSYPMLINTKGMETTDAEMSNWNDIFSPKVIGPDGKQIMETFDDELYPAASRTSASVEGANGSFQEPIFLDDYATTNELARGSMERGATGAVIDNVIDVGPNGIALNKSIIDNFKSNGFESRSGNGSKEWIEDYERKGGEVISVQDGSQARSSLSAAFDPDQVGTNNILASRPEAAIAGILGAIAAAQSNDTYADYSPSNLARLQNDDVGSYQAAQSPQLARAAGLMGQVNKRGVDDPLMGFVAPRIPSELMDKIAYNDRRGITDYLKASAGLIGLY
jgi:hypothetical protein